MCGRYASARSVDDIASAFGVREIDDDVPAADWNVAPTKNVPAVLIRGDVRVLTGVRWGLVPSWATDPSIGNRLVNARVETAAEKPAYREPLARRRCLLPADGWYEWQRRPDGTRQPYFLTTGGTEPCALAGLWDRWYDAEGRRLVSVTILTGPAPADVAHLHDRAPLLVAPEQWASWLDPESAPAVVRSMLTPVAAGVLVSWPVGHAVGDVRSSGPGLAAAVEVVEAPRLF
jgi:putative SOS response-associated peptidase YedK